MCVTITKIYTAVKVFSNFVLTKTFNVSDPFSLKSRYLVLASDMSMLKFLSLLYVV